MSIVPPHIFTAVCKSAFFHLRNIPKIRKFLTTETTKALFHAFVTSKIDYCNSLLYGAPKYLLHRFQQVLNCGARIVYRSKKYDHITPLLMELHWLPIEQRINFQILLITFKTLHNQAPTYLTDLLTYYYVHPQKPCFGILPMILNLMVGILLLLLRHYCGMPYPDLSKIQHQLTFLNADSKKHLFIQ